MFAQPILDGRLGKFARSVGRSLPLVNPENG